MTSLAYHRDTYAMLGPAPLCISLPPSLLDLARKHNIELPPSYLELCRTAGANDLLRYYSSPDSFFLLQPAVLHDPDLGPLLHFMSESQGNFDLAVSCAPGDDPPVYLRDYTATRWIVYSETFSQAIFAQIFDWQFQVRQVDGLCDLEYTLLNGPWQPELLASFDRRATRRPTTHWSMDDITGTTYRYSLSEDSRVQIEATGDKAQLIVTGRTRDDLQRATAEVQRHVQEDTGIDLR